VSKRKPRAACYVFRGAGAWRARRGVRSLRGVRKDWNAKNAKNGKKSLCLSFVLFVFQAFRLVDDPPGGFGESACDRIGRHDIVMISSERPRCHSPPHRIRDGHGVQDLFGRLNCSNETRADVLGTSESPCRGRRTLPRRRGPRRRIRTSSNVCTDAARQCRAPNPFVHKGSLCISLRPSRKAGRTAVLVVGSIVFATFAAPGVTGGAASDIS